MKSSRWIILILVVILAAGLLFLIFGNLLMPKPTAIPNTIMPLTTPILPDGQSTAGSDLTATETPPSSTPQVALPPVDEAAQRLSVPEGFAIRIFADNLPGTPRFMTVGVDGALYVSLYRGGQIARLPDLNQDGMADQIEIAATGLDYPHGLEWHDGWLYVAEADRVTRLWDGDGDGLLETRELVTDNIPGPRGHTSRTLHFGPDNKLYVSAGSSCNVCSESDPRRAAILRFNPDGSIPIDNPFASDPDERMRPLWAWGLRNSVDFLWTPSGQLWANHNGRDNLLDDSNSSDTLPPEEIIIPVQGGKSHGWPYCYTSTLGINQPALAEVLDTQSGLALPEGFDCSFENVVPALFTDLAHSAPLGMTWGGEGLAFSGEYQSSLYVAYHGSWNTSAASIRDCKIERIVLDGEQPVSSETFVTGWRTEGQTCGSANTWGRPADVIVGADGALYISDDKGDRVYRVVYIGQ